MSLQPTAAQDLAVGDLIFVNGRWETIESVRQAHRRLEIRTRRGVVLYAPKRAEYERLTNLPEATP